MSKNLIITMLFGFFVGLGASLQASSCGSGEDHAGEGKASSGSEKASGHHGHSKSEKKGGLDVEQVVDAVRKYVVVDSKTKGGYFMVWDDQEEKALALSLDKIHRSPPRQVSDNVFLVCADFKATDGKVYVLDLYVKEDRRGKIKITDVVTVRKVDKKARYKWVEKHGRWTKSEK